MRVNRACASVVGAIAITVAVLSSPSSRRCTADDAQPSTTNRDIATVRTLLEGLNSNQRAVRQRSERDLLDLGPAVLGRLPPPELLPNAAVRSTVARIRITLERRQAQESVQAAHVTLPGNLKLEEWVRQLEVQTGNRVDVSSLPVDRRHFLVPRACDAVPFWTALQSTIEDAHVRYRFAADSSVLKLVPESDPQADVAWSTAVTGPFRLSVNWVKPRRVTGSDQLQRLRTELAVAPEPRLRALFLKLAAKDFRATGPRGQVFAAADSGAQYDLPLGEGGKYVRWNLDFAAPAGLAAADLYPLKIEGRGAMQIAAGSEHIRFTDLVNGEGTARRRGGVTVSVQKIKSRTEPDGKLSVSVKVLIAYDRGGPAFESHRTWIFHNQVYLDHPDHPPLSANGGFETDLQTDGAVGVTYRFTGLSGALADYQFVYVAPTLIIDVPFKMELNVNQPPVSK